MSVLNAPPDRATIEEIALLKRIDEAMVEKDWWVAQVIRLMADIDHDGFPLVFTGGTALSKAHHLIQRFSEDIDFRVNVHPDTHNRKAYSRFKKNVLENLRTAGFTIDKDKQVRARDGNRYFSIDLEYKTNFSPSRVLRPHIQIEVFVAEMQLPAVRLPVASFVNEVSNQPPEVPQINCINPVESAADKLSALTWRIPDRVKGTNTDDPTIVRHVYDLIMLKNKALEHSDFSQLVIAAVQRDSRRPKNIPAFAEIPLREKFNTMLSILVQDTKYSGEYDNFVEAMSYTQQGEYPAFEVAVNAVRELVQIVDA